MFSRPTRPARHSLDAKQVTPSKKQEPNGLRKEQSLPAIVQHHAGDASLLKAVVSASGQGAQTLLHTGASGHKPLWRTRSVRNKTESYAILQLKCQLNRGITVQVTFPDPASTPRQIRLLHGPAVNCVFRPLEAQHAITAIDSQQLQHNLTVAPSIHVQRYLKIEMQGLAVQSSAAGSVHAVSQLDVVQLSALAAAVAATATQLPVPALSGECAAVDTGAAAVCDEPSADVLMRSPSAHQADQQACVVDDASSRPMVQEAEKHAEQVTGLDAVCRFSCWLNQTRSSLQKGLQSSCKATEKQPTTAEEHQQQGQLQPFGDTDVQADTQREQAYQMPQQQCGLHHNLQQVEATLACNRQQLLQLQSQLNCSSPHKQHANPRVLTAAGRPSTLLSMLRHSTAFSGTDRACSSSCTYSSDSTEANQLCPPSACADAATDQHPVQGLVGVDLQAHTPVQCQTERASVGGQDKSHSHMYPDESAVLLGSVNTGGPASSNGSCSGVHTAGRATAALGYAAAAAGERCGSSCSVRGLAADMAVDAEHVADQHHLEVAAEAFESEVLQDPQLVDSQSCMHHGGRLKQPVQKMSGNPQLTDRRVRSCPAMDTSVRCSRSSIRESSHRSSGSGSTGRCRLRLATNRPNSKGATKQRVSTAKSGQQSSGPMLFRPPALTVVGGPRVSVMLSPEVMRQGQLVKQSCPALTFPRYNDAHSPTKGSWEDLSAVVAAAAADTAFVADNIRAAELVGNNSPGAAANTPLQRPQQLKRELFGSPDQQLTSARMATQGVAPVPVASQSDTTSAQQQQQRFSPAGSLSSAPAGTAGATPYSATSGNNNTQVLQALLFGSSCDFGSMSDHHQLLGQALQDSATSGPAAASVATAAATYTAGAGAAGGWNMTYAGLLDSPGDLSASNAAGPGATPEGSASSLLASPAVAVNSVSAHNMDRKQPQQQQVLQESAHLTPSKSAAEADDHEPLQAAASMQNTPVAPDEDGAAAGEAAAPTPQTALPRVGGVVLSPIAESPELSKGTIAASPGGGAEPASIRSTCKTQPRTGGAQQQATHVLQQQEQHKCGHQTDLLPRSLDELLGLQAGRATMLEQQDEQLQSGLQLQLQPCQQQQHERSNKAPVQPEDKMQHLQALQALASNASETDQQQLLLQELAVQSLLEVQAFNASAKAVGVKSSSGGWKSNTSTPTKQPAPQQQCSTPTKKREPIALLSSTPTKQAGSSAQNQHQAKHGHGTVAAATHSSGGPDLGLRHANRRSLSLAAPANLKKATTAPPTPNKATAAAAATGQPARRSSNCNTASNGRAEAARPGARSADLSFKSPARQQPHQQPAPKTAQSSASHGTLRSSSSGSQAGRPAAASSATAIRSSLHASRQPAAGAAGTRSTSAASRKLLTGDVLERASSVPLRNSNVRMSAVRTSHVKLDLSGFHVRDNAAATADGNNRQLPGIAGSSARATGTGSTAATAAAIRSPAKRSIGAPKYEQLLKSQYGAVPGIRTLQARMPMRGSATSSASGSNKAAAAAASTHKSQYQPLPESRSEPALGCSNTSTAAAAGQQQVQLLLECQSEPVLSSLQLVDMASEESLCYLEEQVNVQGQAVAAAQQVPQPVDCHSEPARGSVSQVRAAATAAGQGLLPESRSEPALGCVGTAGAAAATEARASSAAAALLSHSRHWSASDLHTISTGVRWSQKWSNENSPASSAHASPVKQHKTVNNRQQNNARFSSNMVQDSQSIQPLADEPAQQLRQAVEAVQALVQYSSRRLEQAAPSKQQQQQVRPADDQQQQHSQGTPPRELSQQQQQIAAAAVQSGNNRQWPASPEAQTSFFLPKLVQPQLLTPQSVEPLARQLARGAAVSGAAGATDASLSGLTNTPPGLGLASPISASKQQCRELLQQQPCFAFQCVEQEKAQQPPDHHQQQSIELQQVAHAMLAPSSRSDYSIQDATGDFEPGSPVSIGAAVTDAAATAAPDILAAGDTAASQPLATVLSGSHDCGAASSSNVQLNKVNDTSSPVAKQMQPKARSCQLIANVGKPGADTGAVAASYILVHNAGTASADGLPTCSQAAAAVNGSAASSLSRSELGGKNTVVVSIEKRTPGGQQPPVQFQQTYQLQSHCIADIVQLEAAPGPADSTCTSRSMGGTIGAAGDWQHSICKNFQQQHQEVQSKSQLPRSRLSQQQPADVGVAGAPGASSGAACLHESLAAAKPCSSKSALDGPAEDAYAYAADKDETDSVQSYCTASSQMGTVWPHNNPDHHRPHHQHHEARATGSGNLPGSADTCASSSSVSDTGLQHLRASNAPQGTRASGVLCISSDEDEHVEGVHLARNFYQRTTQKRKSMQHQQQLGTASQQQLQQEGSLQACGHSSAGLPLRNLAVPPSALAAHAWHSSTGLHSQSATCSEHSLWDEHDPLAAEVSSAGAGAAGALNRALQQQDDPPHRVKPGLHSSRQGSVRVRNSAGLSTSSAAGHKPCSRKGAVATGTELLKEGSGKSILSGAAGVSDNESDTASQNEASSASSGVGPSLVHGTAAAAAYFAQHCLGDLPEEGEASSGLQFAGLPQQQQMQETGSSLSFAAMSKQQRSPSPSIAALHGGTCSSHTTTAGGVSPGPATSSMAAQATTAAATPVVTAAVEGRQPAPLTLPPAKSEAASVSSSCGSVAGIGGGMLTLEVSMNDLGLGEQPRIGLYRCSKDQSPNKSPAKDRASPTRLRSSKAAVASHPAAADQAGSDSLHHDAESIASSQESYAGKRYVQCLAAADGQEQCAGADEEHSSSQQRRPVNGAATASVLASPLRSGLQQKQQLQVLLPSSPQVPQRSAMCFSPLHAGRSGGSRSSLVVGGGTPSRTGGPGLLEAALSQQASLAGVQATSVQPAFQNESIIAAAAAADKAAGTEQQSPAPAEQSSFATSTAEEAVSAAAVAPSAARSSTTASASPYGCFAPLHSMLGSGSGKRSSKTQTRVRQEALGAGAGDKEVTGVRKNLMAEMLRAADGAFVAAAGVTPGAAATAEQPDTHELRDSIQRSGALSGSHAGATEHSSTSSRAKPRQQLVQRHIARPHTAGSVLGKPLNMPTIGLSPGTKAKQPPATSHASCSSSSAAAASSERQHSYVSCDPQSLHRRGSDTGSNSTAGLQATKCTGSRVSVGVTSQHSESKDSSPKDSNHRHADVSDSIQLMSHSSAAAMLRAAAATPAPIPDRLAAPAAPSQLDEAQAPHSDVRQQQAGSQSRQGTRAAAPAAGRMGGPAMCCSAPATGLAPPGSNSTSSVKQQQQQQQQSQGPPQSRIPSAPGMTGVSATSTAVFAAAPAAGPLSSGLLRRGNSAGSLSRMLGAVTNGRPSSPGATAAQSYSPAGADTGAAAAVGGSLPGDKSVLLQQQQQGRPYSPASSDMTGPSSMGSAVVHQQQQGPLSRCAAQHTDGLPAQHSEVLSARTAAEGAGTQQTQDAAAALQTTLSSPYLQQLEEHSAQQAQQQQQPPAASPLSSHRRNLQLKLVQQQQSSPAKPVSEVSSPMLGSSPPVHPGPFMRPASCLGYAPGTPTAQRVRGSGSTAGDGADAAAAAGGTTPSAVAAASPQLLGAARRFNSTGGGAAAVAATAGEVAAGASPGAGAARMGRFRHRRTKSDMPELYQPLLSPLESPLHAAMPEDHSDSGLAMVTAAGEHGMCVTGGPLGTAAAGAGRLMLQQFAGQAGCMPTEQPTSPLGSPLRHGLTSAAAMYRLQQQQLQREASATVASQQQQHLETEGTAATAMGLPCLDPSEPELTLKPQQEGMVQAVAEAVAVYEGSMSPRRLARIQEYISGFTSVDLGVSLSPAALTSRGLVGPVIGGAQLAKEFDAVDSFNLNNHTSTQSELEQQQQVLLGAVGAEQSDEMPLSQVVSIAVGASTRTNSHSSRSHASAAIGLDEQQLQQAASHSRHQHTISCGSSHASNHGTQQQQHGQPEAAAAAISADDPRSSGSSSLLSAATEALMQAIAAAAGASGLQGRALLASLHARPDLPALLAASAETLDIQPSEGGLSWQGSRLSQDSQQDAVMQSQGALLGPGPRLGSQGQLEGGDAADNVDGAERPRCMHRGPAGPATAAGMFRRSAHLLAGFAQQMWGPHAVGSVESTAGSNAVGALSRGGLSRGMGVRGSTGSLNHGVQLVHEMAASVEHLAASLDITGPQALQLTQELLLQQLLGQRDSAQQDGQPLAQTTSAAGTAGQQRPKHGPAGVQQQQRALGQNAPGAATLQPQLGPLLAGRLAALAALRQLRRSSVGESPDVTDSRTGLESRRNAGTSALAGAVAAAGLGRGCSVSDSAATAPGAAGSNVRGLCTGGILGRARNTSAPAVGIAAATGAAAGLQSQQQQQGPMARHLGAHRQQQQGATAPATTQRSLLGSEGSHNDVDSLASMPHGSRSHRSSGSRGSSR